MWGTVEQDWIVVLSRRQCRSGDVDRDVDGTLIDYDRPSLAVRSYAFLSHDSSTLLRELELGEARRKCRATIVWGR